jgi:hypothetical protein
VWSICIAEDRDELFLTIFVDSHTHKVIWISHSRKKQALDEFLHLLAKRLAKRLKSLQQTNMLVTEILSNSLHLKRLSFGTGFILFEKFNEALNEEKKEQTKIDPEGVIGDLIDGKYRYIFLTKASQRTKEDVWHVNEVFRLNEKMAKLEIIKEQFYKMFECRNVA